jgi:tRNA-dihydrouridine synthase
MESNKAKIVKVKKNPDGDITDVMMDNGNVYSIDEAIMMVSDHLIDGVNVGRARNGREYLRSNPNDYESDNLDNLPEF